MNAMSLQMRVRRWCGLDEEKPDSAISGARDPIASELDRLSILTAELQHRLSNTFAVVQALAHRSARNCKTVDDFLEAFESRIAVLARVQSAMIRSTDDAAVRLHHLVSGELIALAAEDECVERVTIEGSRALSLQSRAGELVALGLHELAVNSRKYGVLSAEAGNIRIGWHWMQLGGKRFVRLEWHEVGIGPGVKKARRNGFGSELILRALPRQLGTETSYLIDGRGVHCLIDIPAEFIIEDSRLAF